MRKLKIIAAEIVQGRSQWLAVTFEDYHRQLCFNLSSGAGFGYSREVFGSITEWDALLGMEILMIEIPKNAEPFMCWEPMDSPDLVANRKHGMETDRESKRGRANGG